MATTSYLLVIADRTALAWIVAREKMAFGGRSAAQAGKLEPGDKLFIYTTRGCFHNQARDRGRVVGEATVVSDLRTVVPPLRLIGRTFERVCDLDIPALATPRAGVELAPLAATLDAFPSTRHWNLYLRRPLLQISDADASVLRRAIRPLTRPRAEVLPELEPWLPAQP